MTTLYDVILASASAALPLLNHQTGAMPAGHNGPYLDPETPVRNTSHWLVTFLKAYSIANERQYLEAARRCAGYLRSEEVRPQSASFWHRKSRTKDSCNGLIGQAWTIEALASAAAHFPGEGLHRLAQQVFLLHPFDAERGLWRRLDVDGTILSFDSTLNHQLWFAAAGALLLPADDDRVRRRVVCFLTRLSENIRLYPSGLICHALACGPRFVNWLRRAKRAAARTWRQRRLESDAIAMYHKALGYHAFNLYAFGLLRQSLPAHPFWASSHVTKAMAYLHTREFVDGLERNEYGFPYNPVGFEVAFALDVFCDESHGHQAHWVAEQVRRTYDFTSGLMNQRTADPVTLAARIYEACRLANIDVEIDA